MVTSYGEFPGVKVEVAGGGITAVSVGDEEKLVLFGEASYEDDDTLRSDGTEDALESQLTGTPETPAQINARREADTTFGSGSELAEGMREALGNGANIGFLFGVAPRRFNVSDEAQATQSGTLNNAPIYEEDVADESNIQALAVEDDSGPVTMSVEYDYSSPPTQPSSADTVVVNPLTGEYTADAAPDGDYQFDYKYLEWQNAFEAAEVTAIVEEDETGIYCALSDSDVVAADLTSVVETNRNNFKLINAISGAQPNASEVVTSDGETLANDHSNYVRRDAAFDTNAFSKGSVNADDYFKLAPVRVDNSRKTVLGGVGGLFAGNPISDPIYNDPLDGFDELEQSFTRSDANNMRDKGVIPIRQAGSIRVKDNLSTSDATDWERDFWRRRIADRVILIAKTVGDTIIGRINDENTRAAAARLIRAEIRELVNDRLLRPNEADETYHFVDVFEDSTNPNEVNIDIGFTPYGIVKRVNETITIDTSL